VFQESQFIELEEHAPEFVISVSRRISARAKSASAVDFRNGNVAATRNSNKPTELKNIMVVWLLIAVRSLPAGTY